MELSNAAATLNDGIRRILQYLSDICQSYIDDIYVIPRNRDLQEHLNALDRVFSRLCQRKFFDQLSKCVFCSESIPCLGGIVGREGVKIHPSKVEVIQGWPFHRPDTPAVLPGLRPAICSGFAKDAGPLFDTLKRKEYSLTWTTTLRHHFEQLKCRIGQTPVLAIADFTKDFFVRMNASDFAMGGVLFQKEIRNGEEVERPVAFAGRKFKAAEVNYSIRENVVGDSVCASHLTCLPA
ncbi:LOW QUALITY PROTEIN: polyprotein [Phytophthora megakarya]|uniref:Polyprotein n=1 Tax=Phytophthora megakarya TaxID=4795 RepID=A0A225W717_9STRA|nr:LOW QUALITY PROTEIN: polyprotein [Phytophthora megakarya]